MKIAVLGPKGTFSDKAYLEYKNETEESIDSDILEPIYFPTIDEVFNAVSSDAENICDLGIVPIENTLDGYVQRTLDILLEQDVFILSENKVPVQFSMIGNISDISEINKLYVQFKTNGQCRKFINSLHGIDIITTESNMESFYKIENEAGAAAIVPRHIAETEKDRYVIDNVTDADKNFTRFVIIKRGAADISKNVNTETDVKVKVPVFIMPATERPGILFEILKEFHDRQINLISIMSRPTKQEMGTYNFYIEIDGFSSQLDLIIEAIEKIKKYNDIKILGIYNE